MWLDKSFGIWLGVCSDKCLDVLSRHRAFCTRQFVKLHAYVRLDVFLASWHIGSGMCRVHNEGCDWDGDEGQRCNEAIHLCLDMRVDMCLGVCSDMCLDMRSAMCLDICIDVCVDVCLDMCTGMCTGMCIGIC